MESSLGAQIVLLRFNCGLGRGSRVGRNWISSASRVAVTTTDWRSTGGGRWLWLVQITPSHLHAAQMRILSQLARSMRSRVAFAKGALARRRPVHQTRIEGYKGRLSEGISWSSPFPNLLAPYVATEAAHSFTYIRFQIGSRICGSIEEPPRAFNFTTSAFKFTEEVSVSNGFRHQPSCVFKEQT